MAATAVAKQLRAAIGSVPVRNPWTPRQQALLAKLMVLFKRAVARSLVDLGMAARRSTGWLGSDRR